MWRSYQAMCYSTQTEYLNSNRDLSEAQFKRMAFPGRVSPHLGKTKGGCLGHPIKSASQSPICQRIRWLCLWVGELHSGQFSKNLFGAIVFYIYQHIYFYINHMKTLYTHLSDEGTQVQRVLPQLVEWKNQMRTHWFQRKESENDRQNFHSVRTHHVPGSGEDALHMSSHLIFKINS